MVPRTGSADTIEVATRAFAPLGVVSAMAARASTPVLVIAPEAVMRAGGPMTDEANESG